MSFRRLSWLCLVFCFAAFAVGAFSQDRERVVPDRESRQVVTETNPQQNKPEIKRPPLSNQIVVQSAPPLVKKTGSSQPVGPTSNYAASKNASGVGAVMRSSMMRSIQSKLGTPYLYGSNGPNRYDCSGFVWAVFQESGIDFTRTSARSNWSEFEEVTGDERYKFGTLVFFNGLGHMGIVVDEDGFYHASSSKGVTYSKFKGYWEKRIVGFRRVPIEDYLFSTPESK